MNFRTRKNKAVYSHDVNRCGNEPRVNFRMRKRKRTLIKVYFLSASGNGATRKRGVNAASLSVSPIGSIPMEGDKEMSHGPRIKPEQVEAVKSIYGAMPEVKTKDVAKLLGISTSTVQKIRRGEYDDKYMAKTKSYIDAMGRCVAIMSDIVKAIDGALE